MYLIIRKVITQGEVRISRLNIVMNIKNYLRNLSIFLLIYFGGSILCAAVLKGVPGREIVMALGTFGFFVVGMKSEGTLVKSLAQIAVSLWLLTAYSILLGARPFDWAVTIIPIGLTAAIGGAFAQIISKRKPTSNG